ncbi:ABC transporter-like protein [Alcanivorax venustensis ISO4]|uniref:ABC transporter-like protein n=2 Tax=Alloalcanivorax venustensis TaxID=172371 RepID=A0ABS0AF64_9GAMM|nr:ABC transporter-like protein [Alloalcanivorax venustensis ISO4]
MTLVGDMSQLEGEGLIAQLYNFSGISDHRTFLFWLGIGVLLVLAVAATISMTTIWRLSMYGAQVGAELSSRLFKHYMHQSWLFHAGGSSSQLTNQIAQECQRVTNTIISPLMQMNAKIFMVMFMALAIFIYNPIVAMTGILVFSIAYLLLYRTVRRRLMANGRTVTDAQRFRFKLMGEGFGGIKDALLLGRQLIFTQRFEAASRRLAKAQGKNQAMSQVPRYAMELVAFGSIIFLILYLLAVYEGDLGAILPILSVYALAGFKLLPAFQQIYTGVSQIRGNMAAFENLRDDLRASATMPLTRASDEERERPKEWSPNDSIEIANVFFTYPGKTEPALKGLTLTIPANRIIGLVGASGSGKSTAIDMLLGLISPSSGQMLVDGLPLDTDSIRAWQNSLGFVPQSIFLADSSIRENIAFGLPSDQIDNNRIRQAVTTAHLDELISSLPDGLDTRVGERGVQLSGGQRQRIGIARALYYDAEVLILDEATSALDGITEKRIMDGIHELSGKKTIVMIAHRLTTVKKCDHIYLLESGRVLDSGSYDELIKRSSIFERMANHQ